MDNKCIKALKYYKKPKQYKQYKQHKQYKQYEEIKECSVWNDGLVWYTCIKFQLYPMLGNNTKSMVGGSVIMGGKICIPSLDNLEQFGGVLFLLVNFYEG